MFAGEQKVPRAVVKLAVIQVLKSRDRPDDPASCRTRVATATGFPLATSPLTVVLKWELIPPWVSMPRSTRIAVVLRTRRLLKTR